MTEDRKTALDEHVAVAVKGLKWDPYRARTAVGAYTVTDGPMQHGKFGAWFDGAVVGLDFDTIEAAKAAAQADYEARIRSALVPAPSEGVNAKWKCPNRREGPTHRHKKRGEEYTLLGIGKMQAEDWISFQAYFGGPKYGTSSVDMREVAVYRSVDDGSLWVHPREEFEDGRFEALAAPHGTGEGR